MSLQNEHGREIHHENVQKGGQRHIVKSKCLLLDNEDGVQQHFYLFVTGGVRHGNQLIRVPIRNKHYERHLFHESNRNMQHFQFIETDHPHQNKHLESGRRLDLKTVIDTVVSLCKRPLRHHVYVLAEVAPHGAVGRLDDHVEELLFYSPGVYFQLFRFEIVKHHDLFVWSKIVASSVTEVF